MSSVRVGGQLLASYEYDASSNRTAMIDGRNNRTQYSYDAFNRVTNVNHAGIQTETFGYDDSGNLTSYFDGRGGSVGQAFDEANRMVSRTDGAGNTTQFKYDGRGLLTELIEPKRDAQNNPVSRTLYEYNELGSLTKVIDANQGVWQYGYDAEQKLTSITDAEGRTPTTFEYDVLHRMTRTTRPLGMVTSASFDANSNRKTLIDALGRKTTTSYDALDRAKSIAITNSDDTIPQGRSGYTLDYDPEGNLLSVVEQIRNGATTNTRNYSRTYDSRNRLTSTTDPYNRRVSYGYDAANNITTLTDAANRQTSYSYDAMNRLDVASLPGGRQVNHDWTADGLLSKVEYGNGMSRVYGYDNGDRVTSIINTHSGSESEEYVYGYDANSNRESEIRKRNGATTRSIAYQFDALNRLTQASYGGGASVSYGYDKVGNRLSELGTEVGGALVNRTYAYNELNQMSSVTDALTPAQSSTLSYDLNGNLLKEAKPNGQEQRYEYDALNQMTRAASFASNVETTLGSYDYDFQGRRISKTAGSSTTQYVYSGINVVNEFDGNNQLTASYDFGADLLRSDFAGEGERLYFHDALGSTTSLATNTGATVAKYEYDAWGKLISSVQPSANKVNYTGYRKDDETGLDYAQARYYDSSKGRFTSFDPITENGERMNQPQGMNYYGYVMGNPLKFTDPTGEHVFKTITVDGVDYHLTMPTLAEIANGDLTLQISYTPKGKQGRSTITISQHEGETLAYLAKTGNSLYADAFELFYGVSVDQVKVSGWKLWWRSLWNHAPDIALATLGSIAPLKGKVSEVPPETQISSKQPQPSTKGGTGWPRKGEKPRIKSPKTTESMGGEYLDDGVDRVKPFSPSKAKGTRRTIEYIPKTYTGKTIGLGLDKQLYYLHSKGAITYEYWHKRGLTRIPDWKYNLEKSKFKDAFFDVAENSDKIVFDVTGMERTRFYANRSKGFYGKENYTNAELHYILENADKALPGTVYWIDKTEFWQNGRRVKWNGDWFAPVQE
jgi:RHS repeat-associated protein